MPPTFLIFAFDYYYPEGGYNDIQHYVHMGGEDEARKQFTKFCEDTRYDHYELVRVDHDGAYVIETKRKRHAGS
jgi:hypothetical protein